MQRKLLGIINVDFDARGQLLIIYSAFINYFRKNGNKVKQCISYLYTSRKPMIHLGWSSCIIFSLSLVSHETGKANKNMCLNETYSRVGGDRHLSDMFPFKNGLKKKETLYRLCFSTFL